MCRAKTEQGQGRRCLCDSSAARLNRRSNANLRKKYEDSTGSSTPSRALPSLLNKEVTVDSIRADIDTLNELSSSLHSPADLDKIVIKVGEGIATLAEEKYGAPSDDDFAALISSAEDEYNSLQKELKQKRKTLEEKYEAYRAEVVPGNLEKNPPYSYIAKIAELARAGLPKDRIEELHTLSRDVDNLNREVTNQEVDMLVNVEGSNKYRERRKAALNKRNEALVKALEDVGVTLANPDTFLVGEKSNKKALASLQSALSFYPQSWANASNAQQSQGKTLIVRQSTRRAHYREGAWQHSRKIGLLTREEPMPDGWTPDLTDKRDQELVRAVQREDGSWINPITGQTKTFASNAPTNLWIRQHYKYVEDRIHPPTGRGWEHITYNEKCYDHRSGNWEEHERTAWRQPIRAKVEGSRERVDEITVNMDISMTSDVPGHRVALHELAHRFEATIPAIGRAERAFLARRSGDGTDNEEKLSPIYPNSGNKEVGYRDQFINSYMGKVYTGGKHYELLSMGMESLFAGTNNGLTHQPLTIQKPDPDYRHFVLGALTIKPQL